MYTEYVRISSRICIEVEMLLVMESKSGERGGTEGRENMCEREEKKGGKKDKERERERERVCVCVRERERERERVRQRKQEREREKEKEKK